MGSIREIPVTMRGCGKEPSCFKANDLSEATRIRYLGTRGTDTFHLLGQKLRSWRYEAGQAGRAIILPLPATFPVASFFFSSVLLISPAVTWHLVLRVRGKGRGYLAE